jgi:hypothetical protein
MRVRLALVVLLSILRWPLNLQPLSVAAEGQQTPQTTGFTVEYTLIIANSPDCERSLVDNFPVRVQYRTIITGDDGGTNNNGTSVSEWMDSPNMPGIHDIVLLIATSTCIFNDRGTIVQNPRHKSSQSIY